jgi:hypothetical protein
MGSTTKPPGQLGGFPFEAPVCAGGFPGRNWQIRVDASLEGIS